ncbi:MAG TPA: SIMPL domain-containing protein [Candidatus Paceibacterota bacterium]|nr:SIMPL domain-containing protein [Candidatus Paceibacterota bacterium]
MDKGKLYFWILLDIVLVLIIVGAVFFGAPALMAMKASYPPARVITVSAQGKTSATPDLAEISFSVVTQGTNPDTLTQNNVEKMNAVLQFVKSEGISASDTATTGYDLEPTYQYDKNYNRQYIIGYQLTQTVTLKIHDFTKVAPVLGGLAPLGVNQIGGVNFTFNDQDSLIGPARDQAIAKAKTKAQEMAAASGATLGPVVNIAESGVIPPPYYDKLAYGMGSALAANVPTPNIQPGTQDITDTVTITYALQ